MGDAERASTSARYLAAGGAGGDAWAAEARAEGRRGTQRIVQAGEVPAPELVAVRLGVEPGQAVIARRRIMYADDEPCELTDTYYPASIARGTALAGTAKIRGARYACSRSWATSAPGSRRTSRHGCRLRTKRPPSPSPAPNPCSSSSGSPRTPRGAPSSWT